MPGQRRRFSESDVVLGDTRDLGSLSVGGSSDVCPGALKTGIAESYRNSQCFASGVFLV